MTRLDVWRRPSRDFFGFSSNLDTWFNDFFGNREFVELTRQDFSPAADIEETDSHYVFSFDIPGLTKKDVHIEVEGDQLKVSGERKYGKYDEKKGYHFKERSYGNFERTFTLPSSVDPGAIEAYHKDGVLRIAVPKGEAEKPYKVEIQEGGEGFFKKLLGNKQSEKKLAG